MSNVRSVIEDARYEQEYNELLEERELIHKSEVSEYSDEVIFENLCKEVIDDYNLENYIDRIDEWDKLALSQKFEYCYILLEEDQDDDFPLLRQVDVFQNLVKLDINKFDYSEVLVCAFFDKEYGMDNSVQTIYIPYNPLIPKKEYINYINSLEKKSMVEILQKPTTKTYSVYFKQILKLWYLYQQTKFSNTKSKKQFTQYCSSINYSSTQANRMLSKIKKLKN